MTDQQMDDTQTGQQTRLLDLYLAEASPLQGAMYCLMDSLNDDDEDLDGTGVVPHQMFETLMYQRMIDGWLIHQRVRPLPMPDRPNEVGWLLASPGDLGRRIDSSLRRYGVVGRHKSARRRLREFERTMSLPNDSLRPLIPLLQDTSR